jgi:hypothetical protein
MTAGSSILAMILTSLPQLAQVSISILKTRFNRIAQVIEARFSAGVWSASSAPQHHLKQLAKIAIITILAIRV